MTPRSMISTGRCDVCGDQNASVAPLGDDMVCRVCDPENWKLVAEAEKNAWLNGNLDDYTPNRAVWLSPGHSQR